MNDFRNSLHRLNTWAQNNLKDVEVPPVDHSYAKAFDEEQPDAYGEMNDGFVTRPAPTGIKFDEGKPRMDLAPAEAMVEVGKVLAYGVEKYDKVNKAYNWRQGMSWSRPLAAAFRHIAAWQKGERFDPESKQQHLAHAIVNLMFLLTYEETETGVDDRFKYGAKK